MHSDSSVILAFHHLSGRKVEGGCENVGSVLRSRISSHLYSTYAFCISSVYKLSVDVHFMSLYQTVSCRLRKRGVRRVIARHDQDNIHAYLPSWQ